jgi:nucleolar protein 58
MLVLAETAIGFVVFKLSSDAKIDSKDLWKEFETPEGANKAYVLTCSHGQTGSLIG